jgi:hypothetical protein
VLLCSVLHHSVRSCSRRCRAPVFSVAEVSVIFCRSIFSGARAHMILWPLPFFSLSAWAKSVHRLVLFCPCRSSVSQVRRVSAGRDFLRQGCARRFSASRVCSRSGVLVHATKRLLAAVFLFSLGSSSAQLDLVF